MGLSKLIKREIGITIATVLLVTTVFIMFSYSIFKVEVTGEKNVITFGDLSMSFCVDPTDPKCDATIPNLGNIIGTKTENGITKYVPIFPQKDPSSPEDWAKLTPYAFKITNDGDYALYISLYLTKDDEETYQFTHQIQDPNQTLSSFKEPVKDDQIKIAFGEAGTTPTPALYSSKSFIEEPDENGNMVTSTKTRMIANAITLNPKESKVFNLYAWLKEDAENASQGKYFVTQISARGEYIPSNNNS